MASFPRFADSPSRRGRARWVTTAVRNRRSEPDENLSDQRNGVESDDESESERALRGHTRRRRIRDRVEQNSGDG